MAAQLGDLGGDGPIAKRAKSQLFRSSDHHWLSVYRGTQTHSLISELETRRDWREVK